MGGGADPLQLITRGENEREGTLGHARPGSHKAWWCYTASGVLKLTAGHAATTRGQLCGAYAKHCKHSELGSVSLSQILFFT